MTGLICRPIIALICVVGRWQQRHIERTAQFRAWQTAKTEEEKR